MEDNDKKDETKSTDCTCIEGGPICPTCIERSRKAGIPEHTLRWMGLSKEERIRSVMF